MEIKDEKSPVEAQIAEIRAREQVATKGPWYCHAKNGSREDDKWDAEFIAHARQDIPFLLDQLLSAQQRIATLEKERDEANAREAVVKRVARLSALEAEVADLSAQIATQSWQPIETAPKDKTRVLVLVDGVPTIGLFGASINHAVWRDDGWRMLSPQPTLWQPLPPLPLAAQQEPTP